MFTDTEAMLMIRHRNDVNAVVSDAQRIVGRQDRQIANLRSALHVANTINAQMRTDIGRRAIDDLLAFRAAKRKLAH